MKLYEISRRDFLKGVVGAAAGLAVGQAGADKPNPWKKLKPGMTPEQVHDILGEPLSMRGGNDLNIWRYSDGTVRFWKGKLSDWTAR